LNRSGRVIESKVLFGELQVVSDNQVIRKLGNQVIR